MKKIEKIGFIYIDSKLVYLDKSLKMDIENLYKSKNQGNNADILANIANQEVKYNG